MSKEPKSFKKYRAYPARYQERAVGKGIDVCRGLYNTGILDEDAKFPQEDEIKKEPSPLCGTEPCNTKLQGKGSLHLMQSYKMF